MTERILIWGAGAIGGATGAYLHRAGHAVTLADLDAEHVSAINQAGFRISGPIDTFTTRPPAVLAADVSGVWPCIFLAVKAQHTEAACRRLAPHLAPDGYVLSLQNGLCQEMIADVVGAHRTIGGFVNYAGDWLEPGHIRFAARGALMVGELDGTITPRLTALAALLRDFEPRTEATSDLPACLWGKLCFTVLLVAQAVGEASVADCFSRPELLPLWQSLAGEVVAVARAEGVTPRAFDGVDPAAFTPDATVEAARASLRDIVAYNRQGAKTHSGYWRDLAVRKRKTEGPAQLGPVVDIGRRHGIDCAAIRRLLDMLLEIEAGRRAQADGNLRELAAAGR